MKQVKDFLYTLPNKSDLPRVPPSASLRQVVQAMIKGHRRRIVYVVDADDRLQGVISLDALKDTIFRYYLNGRVSSAIVVSDHIAELFTSETAADIMAAEPDTCYEDELLSKVLGRMISEDLKDLPVLDQEGRIIADLDILDLLELWLRQAQEMRP